jgi:hypothetical protein
MKKKKSHTISVERGLLLEKLSTTLRLLDILIILFRLLSFTIIFGLVDDQILAILVVVVTIVRRFFDTPIIETTEVDYWTDVAYPGCK